MLRLVEEFLQGDGGLRLGEPGASYRHCFSTFMYIVQAGSWGGTPHAKGTLSGLL